MTPNQQCPVCGHPANLSPYGLPEDSITPESGSLADHIVCNKCGTFDAGDLVLNMVRREQHWENTRGTLSNAIRAKNNAGTKVSLLRLEDIRECIVAFEISAQ